MKKMHEILKEDIFQVKTTTSDGETLDLVTDKYNAVNTKILSAIKQLNDFLSKHGIEFGKLANSEVTRKRKFMKLPPGDVKCIPRKSMKLNQNQIVVSDPVSESSVKLAPKK